MINMDPARTLLGYLLRHGELNLEDAWDGWGNYDLSPEGVQSAEKAAQWLSFERIGRIVSSDVPRALHTAQIIMDRCNVACPFLATDPNLRPLMVAGFTGQKKTPERLKEFEYYLTHRNIPIPGGESMDQHHDRVQVIASYLCSPYEALPTVVSCHNSTIKSFMGIPDVKEAVMPGGLIAVYMTEKGELEFDAVLGALEPEKGVS